MSQILNFFPLNFMTSLLPPLYTHVRITALIFSGSGQREATVKRKDFPAPTEGVVVTVLLIVEDIDRSRDFYRDVLGAEVVMERDPAILKFSTPS